PSYPPQGPSYPPQVRPASKGKGLWIGLLLLVLIGLGIGGYFVFAGAPNIKAEIERGDQAFERKGGLADAVTAYRAAVDKDANNFQARQRLAVAYLMRGRPDDADPIIRQAINLKPNAAEGHVWLSQVYSDQRKYNEALAEADEAVRLDQNSALAYLARATARADIGLEQKDEDMLNEALADAERSIELAKGETSRLNQALAYNAKGYAQWQLYQFKTQRDNTAGGELVDDGIDQFNQAIGLQDQLPVLQNNLGYFYAQQGYVADFKGDGSAADKFAQANDAFDAAISLDSEYGAAYTGKGWTAIYQKEYEPAILLFDQALQRNPKDPNALVGRGLAHWWLGTLGQGDSAQDYQTAVDNYEAALVEAPSYLSAYIDLGNIYLYSLADYPRAEDTYRRALGRDPAYAEAYAGIGDVLYMQNFYVEAIENYDQALALNPEIATAYLGKANAQAAQGNYSDSLPNYSLALQYNTTLREAYLGKASAEEQLGDSDGARETLEQGLTNVSLDDQWALQNALNELP
ncbi:MAG: tetratricopeptide repeat protein, partial [Herpetosiphonaceae bacterium]|nr:tetratricopeptide repeat protein [Herpetosiphonaceae bacterium]